MESTRHFKCYTFKQLLLKSVAEQIIAKSFEEKHVTQETNNQFRYCF